LSIVLCILCNADERRCTESQPVTPGTIVSYYIGQDTSLMDIDNISSA